MTTTKFAWLAAMALLVACSGATTGVGPGTDGGSSGGDPACTDKPLQGERLCLPGIGKASTPIGIAVDGTGCMACGGTLLPCRVTVTGTSITITANERDCPTTDACPASCGVPQTTCEIPALDPGTYQVHFAAGEDSEDSVTRQLVVSAEGTASSCTLPAGEAPPLQASDYAQSCSGDTDCTVVTEGAACSQCACPNAAIAKSALADYQAAQRESIAECRNNKSGIADCAPCQQLLPHCNGGKCIASSP